MNSKILKEDCKIYQDSQHTKKIKDLFVLIISELSENLILKQQLFSTQGFFPDILFLKLDYFSKKNICTQDILHFLEQHNYKFNDEIIRRFIKRYDKHKNYNLIYEDFLKIISPNDNNIKYKKENNNIDEIFCCILINELKLIGFIGEYVLQIINNNEFDTNKAFFEISQNVKYINKEFLCEFLDNKFNEAEINLLLYYIDSDNDGLISYEDFHDLLMPIKSDYDYDEINDKNYHFNDGINLDDYKNNHINLNEQNNFNNSEEYNNNILLYNQNNYMINNDSNIPNNFENNVHENGINEKKFENFDKKPVQEKFSENYLNCPISQDEEFIKLYNKYYSNDDKNINEINNKYGNNTSRDVAHNIMGEGKVNGPDLNDIQNKLPEKNKMTEDIIYNEKNKNIYPQYNINKSNKKEENFDNLNDNLNNQFKNLQEEEYYDEVNQIPEKNNNINNKMTLQQFPVTFGHNQYNNLRQNINEEQNKILDNNNLNNQATSNMEKIEQATNDYREEMNYYIKKYIYNDININDIDPNDNDINDYKYQTFNNKININNEINNDYNNNYNNDFPSKTFSYSVKEKENISNNSPEENEPTQKKSKSKKEKHCNKNKNHNLIEDINTFLEFVNLIILNENRIEHIKESLALREDLSLKEIFYLFDRDQNNFISINNFQFICKKVFNLFPTLDQVNLLFKRYKKEIINNKQINNTLNLNEFLEMMNPEKHEFKSMINKKNGNDNIKTKLSMRSKTILRELIKSLIQKETNYYKIKSKINEQSLENIWKELIQYSKNKEKISKKYMNKFLEKYGCFLGNAQIGNIFLIFDKEKKGFINYKNFIEEMNY